MSACAYRSIKSPRMVAERTHSGFTTTVLNEKKHVDLGGGNPGETPSPRTGGRMSTHLPGEGLVKARFHPYKGKHHIPRQPREKGNKQITEYSGRITKKTPVKIMRKRRHYKFHGKVSRICRRICLHLRIQWRIGREENPQRHRHHWCETQRSQYAKGGRTLYRGVG